MLTANTSLRLIAVVCLPTHFLAELFCVSEELEAFPMIQVEQGQTFSSSSPSPQHHMPALPLLALEPSWIAFLPSKSCFEFPTIIHATNVHVLFTSSSHLIFTPPVLTVHSSSCDHGNSCPLFTCSYSSSFFNSSRLFFDRSSFSL